MAPKTGKEAVPSPSPGETDWEGDEQDECVYVHEDLFGNEGDAFFHIPMKFGTALDNGDEVIVRFNIEIAADDAEEAKDRASNIMWDELVNGMPFDSESTESIKSFVEDFDGVVYDSVAVDEEPVPDDDFDVLLIDGGPHVVED